MKRLDSSCQTNDTIMSTSSDAVVLKWKVLHPGAILPKRASAGAACFDLYARAGFPTTLFAGRVTAISTGLAVEIPPGYELQIRARSGLSSRGIILANGVGTIDSDYRGEIKVLLYSLDSHCSIDGGERIAQACLARVIPLEHQVVEELSETVRGTGGFGSTGRM